MKNTVIVVGLGVIIFIVVIKLFLAGDERMFGVDNNAKICKGYNEVVQSEIKGIVEKAFMDEANHNFKKVLINDGKQVNTLYLDFDKSGLFGYVEKGDSIIKLENTNVVDVFRNEGERLFKLDFGCVQADN